MLIDQRVESMKELFLRAVLACDELQIVHHQDINGPEQLFEVHDCAVAEGLHETVHELLSRKVEHVHLRLTMCQLPRNGVHQVRFAEPDTTIEK